MATATTTTGARDSVVIAGAGYRVADDLNTYRSIRVRARHLRPGMIVVDEFGLAIGEILYECYGGAWTITDGDRPCTRKYVALDIAAEILE